MTIFFFSNNKVHFKSFSADRKIFNFAQAHPLKLQSFLFVVLEVFFPVLELKKIQWNWNWNCWIQQIIKLNKDWNIAVKNQNVK